MAAGDRFDNLKNIVLVLLVLFLAAVSISIFAIPASLLPGEVTANYSSLEVSTTEPGCPGTQITISVALRGSPAEAEHLRIYFINPNQSLATLFHYENSSGATFTPTAPGNYLIEATSPGVIKGAAAFTITECITCKPPFMLNEKTGKCECPAGTHYNSVTKQCVECNAPRVWIQDSLSCICPDGKYYAEPSNECIPCNPPRSWNTSTLQCECPPGTAYVEHVDTCASCDLPFIINTRNGLCECPPGKTINLVNNTCDDVAACKAPMILNPVTLECECPPGTDFDPNTTECVKCTPPLEWDIVYLKCNCPGDTVLQPDNKTCCSMSFCSKSSQCCSGYCVSNVCVESLPGEKISPFDPDSPYALIFWLFAITFSSISSYLSYRQGTPLAVILFIALPFASAFLISPFAGFAISIAELLISSLMPSALRGKKKALKAGKPESKEKKEKEKPHKKRRMWGEEEDMLDMPPPE